MTNPSKRVKTRNRYSEGLKRKIAKEYLAGKASYAILAEDHNLANKDVVKEFVKWYKRKLESEPLKEIQVKKSGENQENQDSKSGVFTKENEAEALKKKLALADLKIEMLETMIDQAESTLKIDIRKKSGTNQ